MKKKSLPMGIEITVKRTEFYIEDKKYDYGTI